MSGPFKSCNELLETIKKKENAIKQHFTPKYQSVKKVIGLSVDGNTVRGISDTLKYGPLSIFQTWAIQNLAEDAEDKEIREILFNLSEERECFEKFHNKMCKSLSDYWTENDHSELSYAHVRKLIDLLIKHLPLWRNISEEKRKIILENANVPLDKYSLQCFRIIAKGRVRINRNDSMGTVNVHNYAKLQRMIRCCVEPYPALYYDVIAWNRNPDGGLAPKRAMKAKKAKAGLIEKQPKFVIKALNLIGKLRLDDLARIAKLDQNINLKTLSKHLLEAAKNEQ